MSASRSRSTLPRALAAAMLVLGGSFPGACAGRTRGDELVLHVPCDLASRLPFDLADLAGRELVLGAEDRDGRPLPHALLQFRWPAWGALSYQTDARGELHVLFEQDLLAHPVSIQVLTKPEGQDLLARPFEESSFALPGARVRLRM